MNLYDLQRLENKKLEKYELIFLVLVLIIFCFMIWKADIHNSNEAIRYEHDRHARFGIPESQATYQPIGRLTQNGTVNEGLLYSACGEEWYTKFYDRSNRENRIALLNDCNISADEQTYHLNQAQSAVTDLQSKIQNKYSYFIQQELKPDYHRDSIDFSEPMTEKAYFIESLGLTDNGRLTSLDSLAISINDIKPQATDPNVKADILALIASSEGDTAFPYNTLYQEDAETALLLNDTAKTIRDIRHINRDWAYRATKAQTLIKPWVFSLAFVLMAVLTYVILRISRRMQSPVIILGMALIAWSLVAWLLKSIIYLPNNLIYALLVTGVVAMFAMHSQFVGSMRSGRSMPASRFGYPLFVLFLGIGLAIILDISVRSHFKTRYIILNHFTSIFYAFVIVSLAPTISFVLGKLFSRLFAHFLLLQFWPKDNKQKILALASLAIIIITILSLSVVMSTNKAVEILKLWLIFGMASLLALVFYPSLTTSTLSLKQFMFSKKSIVTMVVIFVAIIGLIINKEMGSLLVIIYSSLIIISAYLNFQSGASRANQLVSMVLAFILITVITMSIFMLGPHLSGPLPQRLASMSSPFEAEIDQLAIIHWFREGAPTFGYQLGSIPWCGFNDSRCYAPQQMQSDYTASSIIVLFGYPIGLVLLAGYVGWILLLLRGHFKVNKGIIGIGKHQSFVQVWLLWSGIVWAVLTIVQMLLTVAGNFGVLPLTGITLPFISYGMSSLLVSSLFFGLILNRPFIESLKSAQSQKSRGHTL